MPGGKKRKNGNKLSCVDRKRGYKLTPKHQLFVCAMLATGYNPSVTVGLLEEGHGISILPSTIYNTYLKKPKWKKKISRMRRFFEKQVIRHPLASKINRLDFILKTLNESFTWRLDKIHYDKEGDEISRVEKRNIGLVPGLIREARTEVEGEKPLVKIEENKTTIYNLHDAADKYKENQEKEQDVGTDDKPKNRLRLIT